MQLSFLSQDTIENLTQNDDETWHHVRDALWDIMQRPLYKRWQNKVSAAGIVNSLYGPNDSKHVTRDVEEIFSNTLLTFNTLLVNNRFEWRSEKETLAYIYLLARTEASRMINRKIASLQLFPISDFYHNPHSSGIALSSQSRSKLEDEYEISEIFETVQQILLEMKPRDAYVFRLYVNHDYSHRQIAEELHITDGTSRNILAKVKKYIRIRLNELGIN